MKGTRLPYPQNWCFSSNMIFRHNVEPPARGIPFAIWDCWKTLVLRCGIFASYVPLRFSSSESASSDCKGIPTQPGVRLPNQSCRFSRNSVYISPIYAMLLLNPYEEERETPNETKITLHTAFDLSVNHKRLRKTGWQDRLLGAAPKLC